MTFAHKKNHNNGSGNNDDVASGQKKRKKCKFKSEWGRKREIWKTGREIKAYITSLSLPFSHHRERIRQHRVVIATSTCYLPSAYNAFGMEVKWFVPQEVLPDAFSLFQYSFRSFVKHCVRMCITIWKRASAKLFTHHFEERPTSLVGLLRWLLCFDVWDLEFEAAL